MKINLHHNADINRCSRYYPGALNA